jgi:hypothetical protein
MRTVSINLNIYRDIYIHLPTYTLTLPLYHYSPYKASTSILILITNPIQDANADADAYIYPIRLPYIRDVLRVLTPHLPSSSLNTYKYFRNR